MASPATVIIEKGLFLSLVHLKDSVAVKYLGGEIGMDSVYCCVEQIEANIINFFDYGN